MLLSPSDRKMVLDYLHGSNINTREAGGLESEEMEPQQLLAARRQDRHVASRGRRGKEALGPLAPSLLNQYLEVG